YEHALESVEIVAEIAGVANADGITLATFDSCGDRFSADGGFDDVIHVAHGKTVTRCLFAIRCEVEEVTSGCSLGKGAACVGKIAQRFFNLHTDVLNLAKIRAKDFDAKNGAKPSRQHLSARLNGHPEDICHAGRLDFLVHLGDEPFPRHTGPPLVGWLELYHGFNHRKWCRVGGGFGL